MSKKWKISLSLLGAVGLATIITPLAVSCGEDKDKPQNINPSIEMGEIVYQRSNESKQYLNEVEFEQIKIMLFKV